MKSGFIFVLFAIGMLVCATYAAPASSEVQEENDQKKIKELLDLIDQAAKSQQQDEDEDDDDESVEAQFLKKIFSGVKRLFGGGGYGGYGGGYGGYGGGGYGGGGYGRGGYVSEQQEGDGDNLAENESDSMNKEQAMDDNDNKRNLDRTVEAQLFGKVFSVAKRFIGGRRGILKGLGRFGGGALRGYMNQGSCGGGGGYKAAIEQQEADGDNRADSELTNAKEALELLKDIAKLQEDNDDDVDDENALIEIEQLPSENKGEMAKEDGEDEDDEDEDDAIVQGRRRRRRGRKGRRGRNWRRGRKWRGGRGQKGRGRGRKGRGRGRGRGGRRRGGGSQWAGHLGQMIGGFLGGPSMGGGCPPNMGQGGYPPQQPDMGQGGYPPQQPNMGQGGSYVQDYSD